MTNKLIFVDLPSSDPIAAHKFYEELFGWTINERPRGLFHQIVPDEGLHLGIFDENTNLIATSTWVINPWQDDSSATAMQLRGMAVATNQQKSGLGKLLLDAGITHAKTHNAKYVWAKARDSALNFYLRNNFVSVGDGFTEGVTQMPHHLVVQKLF